MRGKRGANRDGVFYVETIKFSTIAYRYLPVFQIILLSTFSSAGFLASLADTVQPHILLPQVHLTLSLSRSIIEKK